MEERSRWPKENGCGWFGLQYNPVGFRRVETAFYIVSQSVSQSVCLYLRCWSRLSRKLAERTEDVVRGGKKEGSEG